MGKLKQIAAGIMEKKEKIGLNVALFVLSYVVFTFLMGEIGAYLTAIRTGESFHFNIGVLLVRQNWIAGFVLLAILWAVVWVGGGHIRMKSDMPGIGLFGRKKSGGPGEIADSPLENSRFLTEQEKDKFFPAYDYSQLRKAKKDGVPVGAVLDKKGRLKVNFYSGVHSLIIGATGSGKTTTFINPMIQLLGATDCGSSMIMTDPKGELFDLHSEFLKSRGYDVLLLDLRDTYSSSRWNPLDSIWDMYQEYLNAGSGILVHRDSMSAYPELKKMDGEAEDGQFWAEWQGKAYADMTHCQDDVTVARQKIYDEMYEDLNDLVSVMCPVENPKDPLWEKGARSIMMATLLAMLEDSGEPSLDMQKDKFNFYNLNKILTNSEDGFAQLKRYFEGRSQLSQAVTLSRQVLSAAEATMSSYMSITFDKLSMFNDRGLCGLTAATDIQAEQFAERPTALFMKIPDEKDTRHGLAAVFVLCMYKALIKVASAREDLSLPRNVYFILDEFGNMPKIEKFDKMITVGRSRKIWFNMVVQSYSQLNNVYGEQVADIVKSNCGMKMFIGSNDIGTCKEFSELCGNTTVKTTSTSSSTGGKAGDMNISTQMQNRPLIYPSELQKLNNQVSTGNAIIVSFGNYPLKTKYTPSYKCPLYQFGRMDMEELRSHVFRADKVFYNIEKRNNAILGEKESEASA